MYTDVCVCMYEETNRQVLILDLMNSITRGYIPNFLVPTVRRMPLEPFIVLVVGFLRRGLLLFIRRLGY